MKNSRTLASLILSGMSVAIAAADPPAQNKPAVDPAEEISQVPPIPATPAAVKNVLYARPFKLEKGYEFEWRAEHPQVNAGWLLVLEVNPDLVFPRDVAEPVLYVGKTTAERVNVGHESGRVIAIVPSAVNDKGGIALDLSDAMMWFGNPALPEQVDADQIDAQWRLARNAGVKPFSQQSIARVRAGTADVMVVADRAALRKAAAELIKTHSPQEVDLAEQILAESKPVPGAAAAGKSR